MASEMDGSHPNETVNSPGQGSPAQTAPVTALTGVALSFDEGVFRVEILDDAGAPFLSLGPYSDDEIVAVWRGIGRSSGLPLLVAGADGSFSAVAPQVGRVVLGSRIDPRRLKVLTRRRPRFLVKRKAGRLPRRPAVYRGAELASERRPL